MSGRQMIDYGSAVTFAALITHHSSLITNKVSAVKVLISP